ncbi:6682_t:CDS:2, partial [Gigaspora margarita]
HVDLAAWVKEQFNLEVHSTTIGCLVKNKDNIGNNPSKKRQRTVQYLDFGNVLLEWILQNQNKIIISDAILIEKAKTFAKLLKISKNDLKFSYRWLFKFKKRHNLEQIKKHEENVSIDDNVVAVAIPQLREYESGTDKKLNVFNTIKFIVQAWKEVSPEMVLNCFWHTGILPVVQNEEPTNNDNDNELIEEMKEDIEALNLRNAMSFEVYINYPEEENTNKILNDQEILTLVTNIELEKDLNDDNSEDENDSKEIPLITYYEALNAIE